MFHNNPKNGVRMKTIKIALVFVLFVLSFASFAKSAFSYDYSGVGFGSTEIDGYSGSFDATEIASSFSINDTYYVSVNIILDRESGVDIKATTYSIGSHYAFSDTTDLISQLSLIDVNIGSSSLDGTNTSISIINKINENINVSAGFDYLILEGDSEFDFNFGVSYEMPITNKLSLRVAYTTSDDTSSTLIGLIYNY